MVSIINILKSIKEPTCGYPNCNPSQILIFGMYERSENFCHMELLFGSIPF